LKINPVSDALRYLAQVQKKDDGQSRQQKQEKNPKKDQNAEEPDFAEISDEAVSAAIDAFGGDTRATSSGLSVVSAGSGPGLRVILKDGSGAVVRQFTGEEFIRLREAVADGRANGKILDRKL
jgi:hypothetical protein